MVDVYPTKVINYCKTKVFIEDLYMDFLPCATFLNHTRLSRFSCRVRHHDVEMQVS